MKKIVAFAGLGLLATGAFAQTNLQVFYDFGENRKMVTTTLEMFKSDDWGNTFFFVDYDYFTNDFRNEEIMGIKPNKDIYGASSSYFEIARCFNFWGDSQLAPLSIQVEFNGGVGFGSRNWLFGVDYFLHSDDFANTLNLKLLYKTFKGSESHLPLQFTAVWGMGNLFGVEGLNFSGFADVWWEGGKTIFLSEPQLWYSIGQFFGCPNLNIGGELEVSNNFAGYDGWAFRPCAGLKWIF